MKIGSMARVVVGGKGMSKYLKKEGLILDCTRSLNTERSLVYFLQFPDLSICAWFDEKQLVEVVSCRSDEDDPAA